jgi:hypothetical protein
VKTNDDDEVTGVKNSAAAAAMQLAMWEVIHDYDSTYDLDGGNFLRHEGIDNDLEYEVLQMIAAAEDYGDTGVILELEALTSEDAQNQAMLVGFTVTDLGPLQPVPLPAAAWPCVGLLAGVVGWKKYRGRKIEAA